MYRGVIEAITENGMATVSPVGSRSSVGSWKTDCKIPFKVNPKMTIGNECL